MLQILINRFRREFWTDYEFKVWSNYRLSLLRHLSWIFYEHNFGWILRHLMFFRTQFRMDFEVSLPEIPELLAGIPYRV